MMDYSAQPPDGHEGHSHAQPPFEPAYAEYRPRVPHLSGLAMPGAVFLSTGSARVGSDLRLVLAGCAIISLAAVANVLAYVAMALTGLAPHGVPLPALFLGVASPGDVPYFGLWQAGFEIFVFLCFLLTMRLSPLAGYHAAEHMTVACIETYGDVTEEWVRQMPRAHQRCGTNLLAGALPALLIGRPLWGVSPFLAVAVAVLGWMARMQLGWIIQQFFTTKPPSEKQLAAGISAGRGILHLWRLNPEPQLTTLQRLWFRGLPQMIVGVLIGYNAMGFLFEHLHLWLDW